MSERRATAIEFTDSRARIVAAGARERRRLEAVLHDSAQDRIVALLMRLGSHARRRQHCAQLVPSLDLIIVNAEAMTDELRRIAHGILSPVLASQALAVALRSEPSTARSASASWTTASAWSEQDVEPPSTCAASKRPRRRQARGPGAAATVTLQRLAGELRFTSTARARLRHRGDGGAAPVSSTSVTASRPSAAASTSSGARAGTTARGGPVGDGLALEVGTARSGSLAALRSARDRSGADGRGWADASPPTEPPDHPLGTMSGLTRAPSLYRERWAGPDRRLSRGDRWRTTDATTT